MSGCHEVSDDGAVIAGPHADTVDLEGLGRYIPDASRIPDWLRPWPRREEVVETAVRPSAVGRVRVLGTPRVTRPIADLLPHIGEHDAIDTRAAAGEQSHLVAVGDSIKVCADNQRQIRCRVASPLNSKLQQMTDLTLA